MKKFITGLVTTGLLLSSVTPSFAEAASEKNNRLIVGEQKQQEISQGTLLKKVEPFVKVTEQGTLELEGVPTNFYETYNLDQLQAHFDNLNQLALRGNITINKDLSIQDNSIQLNAVYGKWTYHWWGYDRKFTNAQANDYVNYLLSAAAGGAIVTGAGAWFPPVAAIAGTSSGYWALLATRVNANNKGYGVLVEVSWLAVFDVTPL
ncbi:MAG: hypothetical protein ABTA16_06145 [Niallia sp.]